MDPAAGEDWPEALEELMPDLAQEELVGLDEPLSALSSFESQVPCGPPQRLITNVGGRISGDGSRCSLALPGATSRTTFAHHAARLVLCPRRTTTPQLRSMLNLTMQGARPHGATALTKALKRTFA